MIEQEIGLPLVPCPPKGCTLNYMEHGVNVGEGCVFLQASFGDRDLPRELRKQILPMTSLFEPETERLQASSQPPFDKKGRLMPWRMARCSLECHGSFEVQYRFSSESTPHLLPC